MGITRERLRKETNASEIMTTNKLPANFDPSAPLSWNNPAGYRTWDNMTTEEKAHIAHATAYGTIMSKPNRLIPIIGNMFNAHSELCDALLVTTNAHKRNDGSIVMGRGAAKELVLRIDGIDIDFGSQVEHLKPYGVVWAKKHELVIGDWEVPLVGAFQVKRSFKDIASLDLIERSCVALDKWCRAHPKAKVRLNFPGIGNGGLDETRVIPILEECLNLRQVQIWKMPV